MAENLAFKIYKTILRVILEVFSFFPERISEHEEVILRKGLVPDGFLPHPKGMIWLHGASVGEVQTLMPFIRLLNDKYGRERLVTTATTIDGLKLLQKSETSAFSSLLPFDLPEYYNFFIEKIKPSLLLISETEIWPMLLHYAAKKNIPAGLINARINTKSVRMMSMFKGLFRPVLKELSFVFPQNNNYYRRFKILGVPEEKMKIMGSFKYDAISDDACPEAFREKYAIPQERPIICFGSTHPGEEEIIAAALKEILKYHPELIAIVAVRHLRRIHEAEKTFSDYQIPYQKASERKEITEPLFLLDTIGELKSAYATSSLAFVGGSLIERGGHNIMEPALFAKPVVTGPSLFNFASERRTLSKDKALFIVHDELELAALIKDSLQNPQVYKEAGKRGAAALKKMRGASLATFEELENCGYLEL
ncbi:MAG: hypothetical protein GX221_04670 [Candidatus Riflebacteria bacterium]|nr:hypothetical protein [Candidatus Riflebacteria bacterium]